ncbi:MAG: lipoyl protein ligase domain-containing protein, partial [bacterium]
LLHQGDLSFSVIYYLPPSGENNLDSYSVSPWSMMARCYDEVSQVVVEAFKSLGLDPVVEGPHTKNRSVQSPLKYLCFASRVKGEISVNGKKVVGMAIRLYPRSLLLQGSIALKSTETAVDILNVDDSEIWEVKEHLRLFSTSIEDLLGYTFPYDDMAYHLWDAFKRIFPTRDMDFRPMTEEEKAIASTTQEFSLLSFEICSSRPQTVSSPN